MSADEIHRHLPVGAGFGSLSIASAQNVPLRMLVCSVTAIFISGGITNISSNAFANFENLVYAVIETNSASIASNAFFDCPALETVICFGSFEIGNESVQTDAEKLQLFLPKGSTFSGSLDASRASVIKFSFEGGALELNGSVNWDSYQFLDTMTVFCMHFAGIETLKIKDFTFDALQLYGTTTDGTYERIDGNRLTEAELTAEADDETFSFNDLVNGIVDGSISSFHLIAKDSGHDEIKDTPIEIKDDEDEGGIGGLIRKAIKWVVRLLDKMLNVISKLTEKK